MNEMIKAARRHSDKAFLGALALGSMTGAQAAFTVPTEVTDAATNVGLLGAAVFAIYVGIKLYKWLRSAL